MRHLFDLLMEAVTRPSRARQSLPALFAAAMFLIAAAPALALPIGFGRNQGPLTYDEMITPDFHLYFDQRTPHEAAGVLKTLELARPYLEGWMKVSRSRPLPVIMSAATANASFANFITDAVELQTMGYGGRDLALHEYVHSTMYRHLDNIFGPAGSIIHLPWMPAWWIEGLAEALVISVQSDVQMSYERYHAVTGDFPSYDKLHSLYLNRSGDFAERGYATAGAFVAYLLRTYDAARLPELLEDFYHLSMPWQWPRTVVPLIDFMPMDEALRRWTGKSGRELYEEYKVAAAAYWKPRVAGLGGFLFTCDHGCASRGAGSGLIAHGGRLTRLVNDGGALGDEEVTFQDRENGVFRHVADLAVTNEAVSRPYILKKERRCIILRRLHDDSLWHDEVMRLKKDGGMQRILDRKAEILKLFDGVSALFWLEHDAEHTRFCSLSGAFGAGGRRKVTCPLDFVQPTSVAFIGAASDGEDGPTRRIWLRVSTETAYGDKHRLVRYDLESGNWAAFPQPLGGRALDLAETEGGAAAWLLMAGRNERFLRKVDDKGQCREERVMADTPSEMFGVAGGALALYFDFEKGARIVLTNPERFASRPCSPALDHFTPMLYAFASETVPSLSEAVRHGSPWAEPDAAQTGALRARIASSPAIDAMPGDAPQPAPAGVRDHMLFAFPWIGADARGYQFGSLAVPLMDEMQNETLYLSVLYGPNSRFLETDATLTTTRFASTYAASLYRRQRYNGSTQGEVMYYEDRGSSLKMSSFCYSLGASCDIGLVSSYLKPIYGPANFKRHGQYNELHLGLGKDQRIRKAQLSGSIFFNVAPEAINRTWVYNQTGAAVGVSYPWTLWDRTSTWNASLAASGTRGTQRRFLMEFYSPLTTYIPGAGSSLNEINVGILGSGRLTAPFFGDNQVKAKLLWTIPVIYDLEKLIGIFYFERLDFSAFVDYGTAWTDFERLTRDDMLTAHGYQLNLKSDIKGVTINLGLGGGQVVGYNWEAYCMLGFNTLIDQ